MQTWIGLLDCNNFFVSCERLFRPDLARTPVVVLSSNDGCVVARSQEVKDRGIPMGVPYFQVKDSLQKAGTAVFSSHFTLYRDISRRIFNVLQEEVAVCEQYSIDEAFFLYQGDDPQQQAQWLKGQIERAVGVPVSIGIAATKTQAKYANQSTKRLAGAWWMTPADFTELAPTIQLGEIWRVGVGRVRQFAARHLHTVADLQQAPSGWVARQFGVDGARLQHELCGQSALPVVPERAAQQSVMSSRSFRQTSGELAVLADAVAYHVRHTVADIRAQGQVAKTVRVSLRPNRHGAYALRGGVAGVTLPVPSQDTGTIMRVAQELLRELWQPGVPYQKVGVLLSGLQSVATRQETLFLNTITPERPAVWRAVDTLNSRFGDDVVRVGSALREGVWGAKRERLSPSYTTRWQDVPTAHAR